MPGARHRACTRKYLERSFRSVRGIGGHDLNQTICDTRGIFRKSRRRSIHSDPRQ